MKAREKPHYVNNKEFLAAITEYRSKVHRAKELGKPGVLSKQRGQAE